MSILVLGGSGFIGRKAVEEFANTGTNVVAYDVVQSEVPENNVSFVKADILDPLSLGTVFFENHIDAVVHLIGLPDITQCEKDPQLSFYLNVLSLQNALETMRKFDVDFITFASSAAAYGYTSNDPVSESQTRTPNTIYGCHKLIGEEMIKSYAESYGLKYAILRFFNVYGADPAVGKDVISIFIRRALNHQPIVVKGPKKFRDFIHVDSVAYIVRQIVSLRPSSCVLNVGTGLPVTLETLANIVSENFEGLVVTFERDKDDGTGIVADAHELASMLDIRFSNSTDRIEKHVKRFVK